MKVRWSTMIICMLLAALCWLSSADSINAQERDITLSNGQQAEEDDTNLSSDALFQIGDQGYIRPDYTADLAGSDVVRTDFVCSNSEAVQVDQAGYYRVVGGGRAVVTANGYNHEGNLIFAATYCFRCCEDMTNAVLETTSVQTYIINEETDEVSVALQNMPDLTYYKFDYTYSNISMDITCSFDPKKQVLTILSDDQGSATLSVTINNKTFQIKVKTNVVSLNKASALMIPNKKVTLKVKGYSGKVTWKTMKKSVATITSKGVVKAKKVGNTVVYAVINGKRTGCAVSVVTAKLRKVVNAAKKIGKGTYSQPRRMQKGYYDCSSLVWRAYKKIGTTFGDRSYAPVAATIAKYLFSRKKQIKGGLKNKNIQAMKLRPGDLMFLTGAKNGRYKGIYHVEMFAGYQCEGFDSKGNPILGTLWANRPANNYYGWPMGRP